MGNANGKEEDSGDDPSVRSDADRVPGRVGSADSMGNTPPGSPGRSRSPILFAPQVPLAPLETVADDAFDNDWMGDSNGSFGLPLIKVVPTLITWNCGGKVVAVEGSWDNWSSRKSLQKAGKDHTVLLVLPCGLYHYRFIVDGEWRYMSDLPHVADENGLCNNLLDVTDYVPENLDSIAEFKTPPSPDSSYSRSLPVDEDFAKEPPIVPQQLHLSVLGAEDDEDGPMKPEHVVLNHLFIEKGWASQSLVALGLTHRFQSKYVTVVLYKPLRR